MSNATLPAQGFIRLATVLALIPVGKTAWYDGIKKGIYPAPVKLSERTAAYRVEDIRALIASHDKAANGEAEK